jgi:hypothetical protein
MNTTQPTTNELQGAVPIGSGAVLGCALPPVKIYLQWDGDGDPSDTPIEKRGEICWCQDRIFNGDIEYVRLDKVAKLLKALRLVKNWNDALEAKWEDPGYLAIAALNEYEAA